METVDPRSVIVRNRRREDFGDIEGLSASIAKHGLFHPLVVDEDLHLIAGERRLRAVLTLGLAEIEVRRWDGLNEAQKREIELEENTRRKDLTPYERSKWTVELNNQAAANDATELRSKLERNSVRGRPEEAGSLRRVADRIGIPAAEIIRARQHVAAVERHPELISLPQRPAIETANVLDQATPEQRAEITEQISAGDVSLLRAVDRVVSADPKVIAARHAAAWAKARKQINEHIRYLDIDAVVDTFDTYDRDSADRFVTDIRVWADKIEGSMRRGIRLVASKERQA